jgi:hypothetical protein
MSPYRSRSRDSVVGIATHYGLEGPGIESRWGEIFRTYPHRLRGPPNLLYSGYRLFPGGKGGRGVMLTTHPLLVPKLRKSWAITPLTLWVLRGLLRGSLYPYRSVTFLIPVFIGLDATPIDKFVLFLHQGYNAVSSPYLLNSDPRKFAAIYVRENLKWRPRK